MDTERQRANRRLGVILALVAVAFGVAFVLKIALYSPVR